jgi:acetoin utilization deacetylase AcuC-like enzyme
MLHSLVFAYGLHSEMEIIAPVRASREELETFHSSDYMDRIYSKESYSNLDEYGLV